MDIPSGFFAVIAFLCLGYLLFVVEIVVPGGILGILGILSVIYGCYLAFDLGFLWGAGSVVASGVVFAVVVRFMFFSNNGLTLQGDKGERTWKSTDTSLQDLLDAEGVTISDLRPAGVALFGERRVDVVSDSLFFASGTRVRVVEVEGRRVLVEAIEEDAAEDSDTAEDSDATEDSDAAAEDSETAADAQT